MRHLHKKFRIGSKYIFGKGRESDAKCNTQKYTKLEIKLPSYLLPSLFIPL